MSQWNAIALPNGERHVIPVNDLRPHAQAPDCWCRPTDDEGVWVHHSLDQREAFENGERSAA